MGLLAVLSAVQTNILSVIPTCTFDYGKQALAKHGKPPRVIWVPRGGTFGPAAHGPKTNNPRPLRTHRRQIEAHCWGGDTDLTELLAHTVVAAAYLAAHGSFEAIGSDFSGAENEQRGDLGILLLGFDVPVLDVVTPQIVLAAFSEDTSGAVAGDGILETGDT